MNKLTIFILFTLLTTLLSQCSKCSHSSSSPKIARVGSVAPAFKATSVIDGKFIEIDSNNFMGKYTVLFFYPLDWTFVCPTEIIEFSEHMKAFKDLNTDVYGVSVDSKFSHLSWLETPRNKGGLGRINFPLIADLTRSISTAYNVLMEEEGHTLRGLFIIDPKGIIRHISMNDPPVSRNVKETLRLVAGYQYTDSHDEVCPAGWKAQGDATIIPNPKDKLAYFEKSFKNDL